MICRREGPWLSIEDAKRSGFEAVHVKGTACIETDFGIAQDYWVVRKALVFERVLDEENVVEQNCVRAKRDVARGLADGEALHRLEPLAMCVDHADGDIGDIENAPGKPRQPIEALLAWRIEDIERVKSRNPFGFIQGQRWFLHGSAPGKLGWTASGKRSIAQVAADCPS